MKNASIMPSTILQYLSALLDLSVIFSMLLRCDSMMYIVILAGLSLDMLI